VISTRGAVAAALIALCVAAPAAVAHEGNPNYRSEVRTIAPAVPGLEARVLNFDDRIEFVYDGDRDLLVEGYRGEPYLRFRADGRVQVNRRSPAGYLNEDRFAQADVPGRADHRAPPEWRTLAQNGRYDWHDHRIHWMGKGSLPPQVKDESKPAKVFAWSIPLEAGGRRAAVRGTLSWLGRDGGGFPLGAAMSLIAALVAGGLLVVFVRRRRARPGAVKEAW
jgi:hypothetical protein